MATHSPPFQITPLILKLSQDISRELGTISGAKLDLAPVELRRKNYIRTIQASLEIEGNTLSLDQVSHLFEGRRVIGSQKDILEVKNAIKTYEKIMQFDCLSSEDFLKAHHMLMTDLVESAGMWRKKRSWYF